MGGRFAVVLSNSTISLAITFVPFLIVAKCSAHMLAKLENSRGEPVFTVTETQKCFKMNGSGVECNYMEIKYGYAVFLFMNGFACEPGNKTAGDFTVDYHVDPKQGSVSKPCSGIVKSALVDSVIGTGSFWESDSPTAVYYYSVPGGLCHRLSDDTAVRFDIVFANLREGYKQQFYTSDNCSKNSYLFTFDEHCFGNATWGEVDIAECEVSENRECLLGPARKSLFLEGPLRTNVTKWLRKAYSVRAIKSHIFLTCRAPPEEPKDYNMFYFTIVAMFAYLNALCCVGFWGYKKRNEKDSDTSESEGTKSEEEVKPKRQAVSEQKQLGEQPPQGVVNSAEPNIPEPTTTDHDPIFIIEEEISTSK